MGGDILTEDGTTSNTAGHTAIITGGIVDEQGDGTIDILEQNASPTGKRSLQVTNWNISDSQNVQGWLRYGTDPRAAS